MKSGNPFPTSFLMSFLFLEIVTTIPYIFTYLLPFQNSSIDQRGTGLPPAKRHRYVRGRSGRGSSRGPDRRLLGQRPPIRGQRVQRRPHASHVPCPGHKEGPPHYCQCGEHLQHQLGGQAGDR